VSSMMDDVDSMGGVEASRDTMISSWSGAMEDDWGKSGKSSCSMLVGPKERIRRASMVTPCITIGFFYDLFPVFLRDSSWSER